MELNKNNKKMQDLKEYYYIYNYNFEENWGDSFLVFLFIIIS